MKLARGQLRAHISMHWFLVRFGIQSKKYFCNPTAFFWCFLSLSAKRRKEKERHTHTHTKRYTLRLCHVFAQSLRWFKWERKRECWQLAVTLRTIILAIRSCKFSIPLQAYQWLTCMKKGRVLQLSGRVAACWAILTVWAAVLLPHPPSLVPNR